MILLKLGAEHRGVLFIILSLYVVQILYNKRVK